MTDSDACVHSSKYASPDLVNTEEKYKDVQSKCRTAIRVISNAGEENVFLSKSLAGKYEVLEDVYKTSHISYPNGREKSAEWEEVPGILVRAKLGNVGDRLFIPKDRLTFYGVSEEIKVHDTLCVEKKRSTILGENPECYKVIHSSIFR